MKLFDLIRCLSNVTVFIEKEGKVIEKIEKHNVFTNMGRNWLAESSRATAGGFRKVDSIPYYICVGKGSDQQTVSPPGAGTQSESATVTYVESPVEITSGNYLKELDKATTEISDYTNRYEVTLGTSDLTFGSTTSVPVTEFMLVTKPANPLLPGGKKTATGGPYAGTYDNGYGIAYVAIPPITKTSLVSLRILWELRY